MLQYIYQHLQTEQEDAIERIEEINIDEVVEDMIQPGAENNMLMEID